MKRLVVFASFLLALPLLAGESVLKDVHSVYIDSPDIHVTRDIQLAIRHELSGVHVVSRAEDADAVIAFTGRNEMVSPPPQMRVEVPAPGSRNGLGPIEMRTITVSASESSTYDPGYVSGVVRARDGASVVIHAGFPSDFFARQFAARFIAAWKEANR